MPQFAQLVLQLVPGVVKFISQAWCINLDAATGNELDVALTKFYSQWKETQDLSLTLASLVMTTLSLPAENVVVDEVFTKRSQAGPRIFDGGLLCHGLDFSARGLLNNTEGALAKRSYSSLPR
ncbi:hypothetical protein DXG01_013803 [Tephrocybe rancida]|nr:hypothetical protein DXG01_013803 [Tephrocybe rancida]